MNDLPDLDCEVLVVGGGPVGLATAVSRSTTVTWRRTSNPAVAPPPFAAWLIDTFAGSLRSEGCAPP